MTVTPHDVFLSPFAEMHPIIILFLLYHTPPTAPVVQILLRVLKFCLQSLAFINELGYNIEKERDYMASTSAVYARIDTSLKENAEGILSQLGISPSSAIQMLYSQIVLTRGLPLNLHLPASKPVAIGNLSQEEIGREIQKGLDSLKTGKAYTPDEVDAELAREFGI